MRIVILWTVILSLSFSSMHDLFLSSTHSSAQICKVDVSDVCDASASCEIHNLLHFVAIIKGDALAFYPIEVNILSITRTTPHLSPPYQNLYRPPIV